MADPNIPVNPDDIRFSARGDCYVLVDPRRGDVGVIFPAPTGRDFNWRLNVVPPEPTPLPRTASRDEAMDDLLAAYAAFDPQVPARLAEQRPRFSMGYPQIFGPAR